ncbi:Cutinase transcription factor 1 alpha [Colletotrichum higginsianum]|uniref:Cutinase transcription factor 1 alpha n=1 Tax=Colletotrichum higginsianum TaxID=80884 RepID=A0A4T0VNW4_9PEZI|nr:Cutinase transcription factor 1 alpha [Colletotrichum higginsianum]
MPVDGHKKSRAKHACKECNSRRIRCNVTERHPCSNCETSQAACEVLPSRRGRYPRRPKRQKQGEEASSATPEPTGVTAAAAASATPPSAFTSAMAATLASLSTASPSTRLPSSGASQTPFRVETPGEASSTTGASTGASTGGSRFFGESNFITLVPGATEPGGEAVVGDGGLKGRLTFPVVPQTPQSDLATSPASANHISSATERYLRDEGALTFPDTQSCLPALRAYFKWFHPCFPILDRADVARRLVTMDISPLLLQAMLFIGSTYCDEAAIVAMGFKDRSEAKSVTYSRARVLFHSNWEKDEFTLIQSLFLCSFWRGGPTDWRDVRYWLGAVLTLAQTHGLHRSTRFTTKDANFARMRRRVWWSIYVRERQASVSLGLPCRIRDEDCDIEPLTATDLENDSDEQQATNFGASEAEHIHYAIKMVEIAHLLGRIMDTQFAPGRGPPAPAEVAALKQQLEKWRESLPDDMRRGPDVGESSVLTCLIHLAYNHLRILVHRNGWLRNRDEEDKKVALAAACRISRIAEDMLAQKTLQYGQMHLLTSLFAAFCIHAIDVKSADGIGRQLAEHRAQMCLLGLKEIQKYWRINNNVLDLFLQYLDESVAKRLHGSGSDSAAPSNILGSAAAGQSPFQTSGTSPMQGGLLAAQDSSGQTRPDAMEDQYFNLMRTNWEGEDALGDLGLFLDPQLYANGPMQVEGLNFLQRCL